MTTLPTREAHRNAESRTESAAKNRSPLTPLELLFEAAGPPGFDLPAELRRLYGGGLGFDAPCVFANFVQTIDGVVSIPELPRSNSLIAGKSKADRFVMGLPRACADAVIVGSGTMLASPSSTWQPERSYPAATEAFAELRRSRRRPERPTVVFITAGGSFDPAHPALEQQAIVLTTQRAAPRLRSSVPAACEVVAVNDDDRVELPRVLACLRERGHSLILSEAGPTLFSSLLESGLVDELFLTISPLLAAEPHGRVCRSWKGSHSYPAQELPCSRFQCGGTRTTSSSVTG